MNLRLSMNRSRPLALPAALLLALIALPGLAVQAAPLAFLTHSVGDQTYMDNAGELRGKAHGGRRAFNVELVREMMQAVGEVSAIEVIPFNRGLLLLESGPGYALFNVNRTEEREERMKWVGPLQHSTARFYENRNAPTGIGSFDDARNVASICVLRDNVHHRLLEREGFANISPANSYASCVRMLALERVSLTPLSNLSSVELGTSSAETSNLQATLVMLTESEGYLAFSKETPADVTGRWQTALDRLKASGRYETLLDLYFAPE